MIQSSLQFLMDNSPLNYSTAMVTCGQVSYVPWYSLGGFKAVRSPRTQAQTPQCKSGNLIHEMRETLSWGTFLAHQLNDITIFFPPFCLFCFPLITVSFYAFLQQVFVFTASTRNNCLLALTNWYTGTYECSAVEYSHWHFLTFHILFSDNYGGSGGLETPLWSRPPLELNDITWGHT